MTREDLRRVIARRYGVTPDCPWPDEPAIEVFRHAENRKWFALIMEVPRQKLGLSGTGILTVVNVKCDPVTGGVLQKEGGIFPAYHMNKTHWITVALDGSVAAQTIEMLVDLSFTSTALRKKKGAQSSTRGKASAAD